MNDYDLRDLQDKLTIAFVNYQWRLDNPMPLVNENEETRIAAYMSDPIFHAKVMALTASITDIVMKWLKES